MLRAADILVIAAAPAAGGDVDTDLVDDGNASHQENVQQKKIGDPFVADAGAVIAAFDSYERSAAARAKR